MFEKIILYKFLVNQYAVSEIMLKKYSNRYQVESSVKCRIDDYKMHEIKDFTDYELAEKYFNHRVYLFS